MQLLAAAASLQVTLAILGVLALCVCVIYLAESLPSAILALPLALLAINLLAAIATNRSFRRQGALLMFHLALLALVSLLALSRLTYLNGTLELTDGVEFDGKLITSDAGPAHPLDQLAAVRFTNLGFQIDYAPGPLRQGIRNMLEITGPDGIPFRQEISEMQPLKLAGYRFYPTGNKGFAPLFTWHPAAGGPPRTGSVHLPSYPLHAHEQAREWALPGTAQRVWILLDFKEVILQPDQPSQFRPPKNYTLILRIGEHRWELAAGAAIDLPEGRLVFEGLSSWMGYAVFYDWTIPWLLAACLLAVCSLGLHFWTKFAANPWNAESR